MHQKSVQLEVTELLPRGWSETPSAPQSGEAGRARHEDERSGTTGLLMEQVVARENAMQAFKRVRRNKGSPGIDGMTVDQLEPYLREHWAVQRHAEHKDPVFGLLARMEKPHRAAGRSGRGGRRAR